MGPGPLDPGADRGLAGFGTLSARPAYQLEQRHPVLGRLLAQPEPGHGLGALVFPAGPFVFPRFFAGGASQPRDQPASAPWPLWPGHAPVAGLGRVLAGPPALWPAAWGILGRRLGRGPAGGLRAFLGAAPAGLGAARPPCRRPA